MNGKWQVLFYFITGLSFSGYAAEYLYPVCVDEANAFLIYQKNPQHIELWEYDRTSGQAEQLLLSRDTPAGFKLLPDGQSFSFIDNGIIKIKNFLKRSVRSLQLDGPVYQVELLNWIDGRTCYASGKYLESFGIFQIDYEGELLPVVLKEEIDCMYPQKIKNKLFYIERDRNWHYRICLSPYEPIAGDTFKERFANHRSRLLDTQELIAFNDSPIVFLKMISENEGFVIGHPQVVSRTDTVIPFDYYHIINTEGKWSSKKIFSFNIQGDLLLLASPMRLYESILPLLPRHYAKAIIYIDGSDETSHLFMYDWQAEKSTRIEHSEQLFPPINGLAGGLIDDELIRLRMGKLGVQIQLVSILI